MGRSTTETETERDSETESEAGHGPRPSMSEGHETMRRVVTIDGPAGAGKSTVARRLAARLGWRFLDTGAMYRVVTLAAIDRGVDLSSDRALDALAAGLEVVLAHDGVWLDGRDVTDDIRAAAITRASRHVADSPSVRGRLNAWQRAFAPTSNIVTEGRDQGTLVFPDAFRKYFLVASDEERARRRLVEQRKRGEQVDFETVLEDQRRRDARDAERAIAPMKPAPDATIINCTELSVDAVVERLEADVRAALAAVAEPCAAAELERGRGEALGTEPGEAASTVC